MRIYASNNDPFDFCKNCMPDEDEALHELGDVGEGPDGRTNCFAYDAEHPSYDDGIEYKCYICGEILTVEDN